MVTDNVPVVGIVGAGPLGIELAIALTKARIPYFLFDKGQAAQMIYNFPPHTHFFSSSERIGIAGVPIQTSYQDKCTREEYLSYIRSVVMHYRIKINSYEEVIRIEKSLSKGFTLTTHSAQGEQSYQVRFLVLATGGTSRPRLLDIPGEDLPHVFTKMGDPHQYFQKQIVIVGGKNSAAETALRCWNAGAKICLVHRREAFDPVHIKYWLLPELLGRIEHGEIECLYSSKLAEIQSNQVLIKKIDQDGLVGKKTDFVIKAIGFHANMDLFQQLGITLSAENQMVLHDENMQVNVPDVFVLGTVVAGTQNRYRIFIENTHIHVEKIMKALFAKLSIKGEPWKSPYPSYSSLEE